MRRKKISKNKKRFLVGGLGALMIFILTLGFFWQNQPVPHSNSIDKRISLRSNQPINASAIIANPEYQQLTFETPAKPKFSLKSQIAAAIKTLKSMTEPRTEDIEERGTWLWTPTMQLTPEYTSSIIEGAAANNINTIYISIDSYLDIFTMPKGPERERLKEEFSQKLENFIRKANSFGVAVDAEAGWQNWTEPDHTYKAFAIANYVKNFNETRKYKFRGLQYDVEPYLLDAFVEDPAAVLYRFVELVDKTQQFLGESDLRFSVVVPDFYDEKDKFTPKFTYQKNKAAVFKHLLNVLDQRANSSIIVMSYRTFADGHDGSIEISQNEMQTALRGNHTTRVIIAQETGDVPPPYITFHRTSKEHLNKQIGRLQQTFGKNENFGGIAIHYVNSLLTLK